MIEHIDILKTALIQEFYQLYDYYYEDEIYACTLVFNKYLSIDYLAVSTKRSMFSEDEDSKQYLSPSDQWNVPKWRYRSSPAVDSGLTKFKFILADYFNSQHSFGNPLLDNPQPDASNNLDILLNAFKQAKEALVDSYGLDIDQILFFISIPTQPEIELQSARYLNPENRLLLNFLKIKEPKKQTEHPTSKRFKLTQADKDMLIDIAQLVEVEPYDYLQVAQAAYMLTLEPHFIDTNIYIQKLVQTIAAMPSGERGSCEMPKKEILARLSQFYHLSNFAQHPADSL
ncbi:DUF4303 domain-containing protein [Acinetobacter cumulans]|jgi:hypothetical protein|uniref:DUF4303 domain-containing protein n=1 Tax=Acinetobacter cumulans TaxID=2136182 RepID=A0A3A8GJ07_9GAMM|nr:MULTISPECIES: DUF4303 domain-containing protein [Acinetobacter]QCO20241.1 DUF4303 domain-containing protein [Acinetobacter cumulans]RKG45591.1 DUF4303 domain-containing protein [Acinetobacter cumulans]RKG49400.1 DUF4303 domain-containing protein [Acinetobacter cumulans]RKG52993.1 DUF4303 domain-containing protein [Acinetobacter cumulans]RLL46066.1 DUF4303 domain-containing protein [Acinetobacter cumulans]